jgi:hypothetical protein
MGSNKFHNTTIKNNEPNAFPNNLTELSLGPEAISSGNELIRANNLEEPYMNGTGDFKKAN